PCRSGPVSGWSPRRCRWPRPMTPPGQPPSRPNPRSSPVPETAMAEPQLDRRQLLRALLLAAGGLAVPAACGVPSGGGPIVDAPGPSYDPGTTARGRAPQPGDATSASECVEFFLYAISGPLTTAALNDARGRARKFLTGPARDSWKPTENVVTVVRIDALTQSISGSDWIVSSTLKPVGTLVRDRGLVDASTAGDPWQV